MAIYTSIKYNIQNEVMNGKEWSNEVMNGKEWSHEVMNGKIPVRFLQYDNTLPTQERCTSSCLANSPNQWEH